MSAKKPGSLHVIRTLRIPAIMDKALRKAAEESNMSVNALVEASLTKFLEFDKQAEELDFCSIRKITLAKLLEHLTDDGIREVGKWAAAESGPEMLQFYHGDSNLDSILYTYGSILSKYARLFTFHHESEGRNHTILLTHRMGKNWSMFLDTQLKGIFARAGIELHSEVSANFVRCSFVGR